VMRFGSLTGGGPELRSCGGRSGTSLHSTQPEWDGIDLVRKEHLPICLNYGTLNTTDPLVCDRKALFQGLYQNQGECSKSENWTGSA